MKELESISLKAKQLYDDLKNLEESIKAENLEDINFNYFKNATKQNALSGHILKKENEYVQKNYLDLISSLLMFNNKKEIKSSQIMYISRLIEGIDNKNLDIENIYSHAMVMNGQQISKCADAIKSYKDVFVVDSLICANIKGRASDEILEYLSEIYSIMGIKFDEFQSLLKFANCILNKTIDDISIENPNRFNHYIKAFFKEKVFYKFEDISTNDTDDIVLFSDDINLKHINLKYSNVEFNEEYCSFDVENIESLGIKQKVINLNKYSFRSLKFINCKFDFSEIVSLISTNKEIEFVNCIIENVVDIYRAKDKYISPIKVQNAKFSSCIFKNFKNKQEYINYLDPNNISIIFAEKCKFNNTQFINCNINVPGFSESCFLYLYNSRLENSVFINNSLNEKPLIKSIYSEINIILLKNCCLYTEYIGFKRSSFWEKEGDDSLLYLKDSKIANSKFECCAGINKNNANKQNVGVLLIMNNSKEVNNNFIDCKFYSIKEEEN